MRPRDPNILARELRHDQAPGFYRLKVGDLEVTALYDGTGAFDPQWLNGTKATMDGVVKALHEDPHMLMPGCGSRSRVRTGDKAGQRYQESGGEAHRISLEHVPTPNNW